MPCSRRAKVYGGAVIPLILSVCVLAVGHLHAQVAGATLLGSVTDVSGATIPGAAVVVRNQATSVSREVTTDSAGFFSVSNVLPGIYDVSVSASGFSTRVATGVVLTVGATQSLNFNMQVGNVSEKVEVPDIAPTVQLATSTVIAEVDARTVRELPLNGRDWTQLATL